MTAVQRRDDESPTGLSSGIDLNVLSIVQLEFDLAEQRIKRTESRTGKNPFPAVNELRYVARHILCAQGYCQHPDEADELADHDDRDWCYEGPANELRRAKDHCRRARYDAVEFEVLFHIKAIELFTTDYRLVPLSGDTEKRYNEAHAVARAAKASAEKARMVVGKRRAHYAEELDKSCDKLADALSALEACRTQLNAQKMKVYFGYIAFVMTVITALYNVALVTRGYVEKRLGLQGAPSAASSNRSDAPPAGH